MSRDDGIYGSGSPRGAGLIPRLRSGLDCPPERQSIDPAQVPDATAANAKPNQLEFSRYCSWIYIREDGGVPLRIFPGNARGEYVVMRKGQNLFIGKGYVAVAHNGTPPNGDVIIDAATEDDIRVISLNSFATASGSTGATPNKSGAGSITPTNPTTTVTAPPIGYFSELISVDILWDFPGATPNENLDVFPSGSTAVGQPKLVLAPGDRVTLYGVNPVTGGYAPTCEIENIAIATGNGQIQYNGLA